MLKKRIWAKKSFHNSSLCLATVVLVLASGLARATDDKCDAICGDVEEEKDAMEKILGHMTTTTPKPSSGMQSRIVNGYMPPERPFMALILNYIDRDTDMKATCGGSIINNQFILTAGHCVCMAEVNDPGGNFPHVYCTVDSVPQFQYDFKKNVKVYIGLSHDADIKDTKLRRKFEHDIKAIIVYPTWKAATGMVDDDGADLALIQLAKKLEWSKMIKPICLPKVELKVPENKAYVAGWGNTEMDDQAKGTEHGNCKTDNRGPSRNMKCRFPFKFMEEDMEYEECQTNIFPPDENPKCQQFHNFHKNNFEWGETSHVKIKYNRGKDKTVCFPPDNEHGWCGVCLQYDKPGEEGYCNGHMVGNEATQNRNDEYDIPDDIDEEEIEKEATKVKPGKNWGYCQESCSKSAADKEEMQKHLLETTQTIFNNDDCQTMFDVIGSPETVKKTEVCAGLKNPFPKYKIYERKFVKKFNATDNVYKFVFEKEEVDRLDQPEEIVKLGFYIGYSDSCEGDSGGPLYQFDGGKAFQRGIVSRGADLQGGCANSNSPGIYTQVHSFIDWIVENSKSGTC